MISYLYELIMRLHVPSIFKYFLYKNVFHFILLLYPASLKARKIELDNFVILQKFTLSKFFQILKINLTWSVFAFCYLKNAFVASYPLLLY